MLKNFIWKKNKFPKILIVDDILVYGRTIENIFNKLLDEILKISKEEKFTLYQKLIKSVNIKILMRNDERLLLDENLYFKLEAEYKVYRKEWQDLLQRIVWFIQIINVASFSFSPFYEIKKELSVLGWNEFSLSLRETKAKFFYQTLKGNNGKIILIVRQYSSYYCKIPSLIPFICVGNFNEEKVINSFLNLLNDDFPILKEYLLEENRIQVLNYILELVVLDKFCKDANFNLKDKLEINGNFENNQKLKEELLKLNLGEIYEYLPMWFEGVEINFKENLTVKEMLNCNRKIENFLFERELSDEKISRKSMKNWLRISKHNSFTLDDFVKNEELKDFSYIHKICSLLMFIDSNIIYKEGENFYTTELALFLKPRQFYFYMETLRLIEVKYKSFGKEQVLRHAREFRKYLIEKKLDLLDEIPDFEKFIEMWYEMDLKLDIWNILLSYTVDGQEVFLPNSTRMEHLDFCRLIQARVRNAFKDYVGW